MKLEVNADYSDIKRVVISTNEDMSGCLTLVMPARLAKRIYKQTLVAILEKEATK
jgi:hypothetical protein